MLRRTHEQQTLFNLAMAARKSSTATTTEGFLTTEDGKKLLRFCAERMTCTEEQALFLACGLRRKLSSLYRKRRSNMRLYQFVVDDFRMQVSYYDHWSGVQVWPGSLSLLLAVLDGSYQGQKEAPPAPLPEPVGAKTQRAYYTIKGFVRSQVDEFMGGYRADAKAWHEMVKMVKKGG